MEQKIEYDNDGNPVKPLEPTNDKPEAPTASDGEASEPKKKAQTQSDEIIL